MQVFILLHNRVTFYIKRGKNCFMRYPDNCPPRKIPPLVRVGVWVKVRVSFRVGGWSDNCPREKLPPPVMARVWVRVSFGVGRQFSSRAIVLEPLWMTASRLFHSLKNCFLPSSELIEPSFLYFWTCFIMAFERD